MIQCFLTGSCTDNPLTFPFAASQFSDYKVKLNVEDQAICLRDTKKDKDVSYTIDFLFKHKICAIATKGFDGNFVDEYRISYSIDGESWNNSNVFRREHVST